MLLADRVERIVDDFDQIHSKEILEALGGIQEYFSSPLTSSYLQEKIEEIRRTEDEDERKSMCLRLLPYADWYLRGL